MHVAGQKRNIALIGSRRSGSTVLMQMIAASKSVKFVNQPLALESGARRQRNLISEFYSTRYFLELDALSKKNLIAYFERISSGRYKLDEPWRIWRPDFHFYSNRIVFKLTNAHYLSSILGDELGFALINFVRHPLQQSASCFRNGWSDHLDHFAASEFFMEHQLNVRQRTLLLEMQKTGQYNERLWLTWVLENLPILRLGGNQDSIIYYEHLIEMPKPVYRNISSEIGTDFDRGIRQLERPSYSSRRHSTKKAKESISSGGMIRHELEAHKSIPKADKIKMQGLLDCFEIENYSAFDLRPRAEPPYLETTIRDSEQ